MLVDVVMPVRNGQEFISEAIASLQRQSEPSWRLFILDHGSIDGTLKIATEFARQDKRINLIDGSSYRSLSAIRNAGFEVCGSEFVMLHDADDVSLPNRIATSIRAFDRYPNAVAIGGQANVVNGAGQQLGRMVRYTDSNRIAAAIPFCNPIAQPTVIFQRSGLIQHNVRYGHDFLGAVYDKDIVVHEDVVEDYFLFSQLAILGKVANINDTVIEYRIHGGNTSVVNRKRQILKSLSVSRYIVETLAARSKKIYVDPAPLCNHGGQLFDLPSNIDSYAIFQDLSKLLRHAFGPSSGLERELAYRRSITTRSNVLLLIKHIAFCARYSPEMDEAIAVREWFVGPMRGRPRIKLPESTGKRSIGG